MSHDTNTIDSRTHEGELNKLMQTSLLKQEAIQITQ
jgi:hypothetical protein